MSIRVEVRGDATRGLADKLNSGAILTAAGKALLAGVEHAFEQEGPGWAPLAEPTVRERRRKGFGPRHPIQQRTGSYRRSWKGAISGNELVIASNDERAGFLSQPGRNRPARPVAIPEGDVEAAIAAADKVALSG